MPLVTSYTEDSLAAFMVAELSDVAAALGWDVDDANIAHAVNRTARLLESEIADVTDMDALETIAVWQAWDRVVAATVPRYDSSEGTQSRRRSQMHAQATTRRNAARQDAWQYLDAGTVTTYSVTRTNNPYRAYEVSE